MRRLQIASLLTLVLALTGGFAAPSRPVEGSRLVVSVAWLDATQAKRPARHHTAHVPHVRRIRVSQPFIVHAPIIRPALTAYSLFQRPPPASRT
jgi:hypothetical protein